MHEPLSVLQKIERDPHSIKKIKNPTEDEMLMAVDLDPETIQYFIEQATPEVRLRALANDPRVIRHFPKPTEEEQNVILYLIPDGYKLLKTISPNLVDTEIADWLQSHKFIL